MHVAAVSSSIEIGEEGCATLLALGVYTAFSALSVFLEGEKKNPCSLGQVSPSSHGSDDNRFVYASELVCTRPTIFSSH